MIKSIYVKDEDLAVFEEALKYGEDSLSQIIADALRQYVSRKKAEEEIVLEVGIRQDRGAIDIRKIAFRGQLLAEFEQLYGVMVNIEWRLYQTAKGKFLLCWKDWSRREGESDIADYLILDDLPMPGTVCSGTIFGDPSYPVPGELIEKAAIALSKDVVQHLDV